MEDLTLEDLQCLKDWADMLFGSEFSMSDRDFKLAARIEERVYQLEELNNLDLDDCAGGACKL